jgi:hypothetical protein
VVRLPFRAGATFAACAHGVSPRPDAPCDPGVAVFDDQEGDLSADVVVSPTAVSTEAPLGTRIPIKNTVADNGLPRLSTAEYRILEIVSP